MKNDNQYKSVLMLLASALILAMLTAVFAYVWYTHYAYSEASAEPFFLRGNYVMIGLYALMMFLFYKLYGGFRIDQQRVSEILYSQILAVICVNLVTYLQLCLIGKWRFLANVKPVIHMTFADIALITVWALVARFAYVKLFPPRKTILIYGRQSPDDLLRKIKTRADKYSVEEMISIEENLDSIKMRIRAYSSAIFTDIPSEIRNELLKYCFSENIRCYCVPKISDIMIQSAKPIHMFDTALLVFRNMGLKPESRFAKRVFDITLSLLLMVLMVPVMALIAIAVKSYDGGPVFFRQERLTVDGKIFRILKFRSMYHEPQETQYCMTRKNDTRITPVGKILRNSHLDELPQLYNIFKGDMSFVGPRPECPELAAQYEKKLPEFSFRLKVKAGLTGYAQVYGQYNTTPYDKLKLDLTYIENYSFLLDLKLILLTVKFLFQDESSEGIEPWQNSAETDGEDKV